MSLTRIRQKLPIAALAISTALAAFTVLEAARAPYARAESILPLRSEEATLLIGVDSARTSVVTMVAVPSPPSGTAPNRPVRRLIGTAVVLSPHRLLTTASLAIPGGSFSLLLGNGIKREARVRGVDRQSNIALFSVEGAPLVPLRQASPQSVAVGSWVAVIANTNITQPQIVLGQVTGRGERVDFPYSGDIVEIEASTYPGASGGAVLNELGEWVAIVVGRAGEAPPRTPPSPVGDGHDSGSKANDILIALPVDQLQRIAQDLEQYGAVRRAFLGIQMRRGILADSLGVLVEGIVPDSPAQRAGLREGDRILALEGNVIRSGDEITSLVRAMKPGQGIEMTVSRGTEIFPVQAILAAAVVPPTMSPPSGRDAELERLKRSRQKLEEEKQKVDSKIRELEGTSGR